jgi:hypothetical protein
VPAVPMAQPIAPSSSSRPTSSSGHAVESTSAASSSSTRGRPSPLLKASTASSSAISSSATTPIGTPRYDQSHSPAVSHRSSFADNLRNYPPSPRATRNHSFSGSALAELLMLPPSKTNGEDARFKGRDWRSIQVSEIIEPTEVRFVQLDTNLEHPTWCSCASRPRPRRQ